MSDARTREEALDPAASFIVQAPAGSGKTELLIQRYLTLLAAVDAPEQIVAITFTRKAAAEMRSRIVGALQAAAAGEAVDAEHRRTTRKLALTALARDAELGWRIVEQPQRLRVDTLDALNAWLAQRLPLLAGGAAGAAVSDDADALAAEAAHRTLDALNDDAPLGLALRSLLPALHNSVPRFEKLLADLLPRRDQWQRHLFAHDEQTLRSRLEGALERLVADALADLNRQWHAGRFAGLGTLLAHAAEHATRAGLVDELAAWRGAAAAPAAGAAGLDAWRGVAALLLTNDGEWRRRVTKAEGFGPAHADEKQALLDVLAGVDGDATLSAQLAEVRELPPARFSEQQWDDLVALIRVLLHIVAELRVLFTEQAQVDFVALAEAAERALGSVDAPSELLLALDHRIQHLLVDEFQDTSHAQVRLLELLTAGWTRGDGRTLFLVGDPMQSIYRFRDADMSLFLKAKRHGVGGVACRSLVLESNFRSRPAIVEFTNECFARVFPDRDRPEHGTASFQPSRAARAPGRDDGVHWHVLRDSSLSAEVDCVTDIVGAELARAPNASIGILVQSRSHLAGLRTRLAAHGWPVRAVEIDAVADTQLGQDLIGLARAVCHAADRIAWLAVLRAPWCGLRWSDLAALAEGEPDRTVPELLADAAALERLSDDGRARAGALWQTFEAARRDQGRLPFADWLERLWKRLEGPAAIGPEDDPAVADRFFAGFAALTAGGRLPDPAAIDQAFASAGSEADPPGGPGVQIMTIHRAKGLEFDTVILFGLARKPRGDDARALYWTERLRADGQGDLLLAPLARGHDRLYGYLRRREQKLELAERARVLYVATTRASERLHLVANLGESDTPPARSLLTFLWPEPAAAIDPAPQRAGSPPLPEAGSVVLRRFESLEPVGIEAGGLPGDANGLAPEYEWVSRTAVQVGRLVHAELQRLTDHAAAGMPPAVDADAESRFRRTLRLLGVPDGQLAAAAARARAALDKVLDDPTGRWLLTPHMESAAELQLTLRTAAGLERVQLDRSFVVDGTRWIVDYKTSMHEGADVDAFIDSEVARYSPQLERYARAVAAFDARPIRVGLYFPLLRQFRSWTPAAVTAYSEPGNENGR